MYVIIDCGDYFSDKPAPDRKKKRREQLTGEGKPYLRPDFPPYFIRV
jgi:hypothetical protein